MKLKTIRNLRPFFKDGEILSIEDWTKRLNLPQELVLSMVDGKNDIDILDIPSCMIEIDEQLHLTHYKNFNDGVVSITRKNQVFTPEEGEAIMNNIRKAFPNLNDLLK